MSQSRPSAFSSLRMGEVIREKVQDGLTGETKEMQYTQCKIVGNGSFGVVFQTKLAPNGEDAAIKRVLQDKRFKNRELQIMRIVRHPNIVELKAFYYSNGERKDEVYLNLVLEFVPETVYRASRYFNKMKTTMPILEVKLYIYQLFRSLAYIHSQGICHRDIKPQNLLLDPNTGILKLCDFGSAKILVENEPNVSYICSRYYRAPELIFGATNYTTKIDRLSAIEAMVHPFFDELREPGTRLPDSRHPNGPSKDLPELFNFTRHEPDDYERRSQRRRYEEPLDVQVGRQLLTVADSALKRPEDDIVGVAKTLVQHYDDVEVRNTFLETLLQMVVEQPLKVPFLAAIVLVANPEKSVIATDVLSRTGESAQKFIDTGSWREFKLLLRFLACMQGLFEGDGIFDILEELFSRAVDLQTASSEDALGLELVKIILLTIPYVISSSADGFEQQAVALLEKTDVIASTPHSLEALVDPYPGEEKPRESQSLIGLLQKQLQEESTHEWTLACLPRPWRTISEESSTDLLASAPKHTFPNITVPEVVNAGSKSILPEIYFSVYTDTEVESVPPTTDIASSLLRDSLVDTINILDYNRHATAKFLSEVDCYFSPGIFVKRATPFDRLREIPAGKTTWKPEDVAVDAVFSQLFRLPTAEHKLVYYHSVLTECCKIAPAAIAPSLGRAIRFLYRNLDSMDMELAYRFMDWFSHHLSNFGFTWKWTEWIDDLELPDVHIRKAFMLGALDKEVRLSFAQRIRGTLPDPYQPIISEAKEKDTPDFKYDNDLSEPLVPSTDAYVTSICYIGSKSLSHVLSCIERCKERLMAIGGDSSAARRQIITSVMEYWREQPGVGVNIIDKLLNYTILSPMSVVEWVLVDHLDRGRILSLSHTYEMIASTVSKVTKRMRDIVAASRRENLTDVEIKMLDDTLQRERPEVTNLFKLIEDALLGVAQGSSDDAIEAGDGNTNEEALLRAWGERWLRVFRRKLAVEESLWQEESAKGAANGNAISATE
ncbi:hypothetical protein L228DRAFT_253707 [Xylona heveae TC161]|uniref:Protein kinase domain-containing protein n=1 Tax=Xylona heveae (strain CBS 132557 / TC161) TaxID=1328760 RepID=A0A165FR70_XYLHT|nr:hypothetical protein L228DRAFT_253707 [Xylona heveae TC161]KZF21279.1 hypothetical protein L228DRAFT_253707 [Xylona heveae TC161]